MEDNLTFTIEKTRIEEMKNLITSKFDEFYEKSEESLTIKQLQSKKLQLMGDIGVLLTKFSDETGVEIEYITIDDVIRKFGEDIPCKYFVDVDIKV